MLLFMITVFPVALVNPICAIFHASCSEAKLCDLSECSGIHNQPLLTCLLPLFVRSALTCTCSEEKRRTLQTATPVWCVFDKYTAWADQSHLHLAPKTSNQSGSQSLTWSMNEAHILLGPGDIHAKGGGIISNTSRQSVQWIMYNAVVS